MKKFILAMVLITTILVSSSAFAGEANVYHVVLVDLKDDVAPNRLKR